MVLHCMDPDEPVLKCMDLFYSIVSHTLNCFVYFVFILLIYVLGTCVLLIYIVNYSVWYCIVLYCISYRIELYCIFLMNLTIHPHTSIYSDVKRANAIVLTHRNSTA